MTILTTTRCNLRQFINEDAELLLPILGCPDVMRYSMTGAMDLPAIQTTMNKWRELYTMRGFCPWAVMYGDILIGYAGLDVREVGGKECTQITFRLDKKHWGKGFATELAIAIKNYAFNDLGLTRIIAITDPENLISIRTITKIGMKFDKKINYGGLELNLYKIEKD